MDISRTPCMSVHLSTAVQECCNARNRVFFNAVRVAQDAAETPQPSPATEQELLNLIEEHSTYVTETKAAIAYRHAMPDPSTRQSVKEYVSCVVHGITVGAIPASEGMELLAAAKVALASIKCTPSPDAKKGKGAFGLPSLASLSSLLKEESLAESK